MGGGHGKPSMVKASRRQPPIPGIVPKPKKYFYFLPNMGAQLFAERRRANMASVGNRSSQ